MIWPGEGYMMLFSKFKSIKIDYIKKRDVATLIFLIFMFVLLTIGVSIGTKAYKENQIDSMCKNMDVFGENQNRQFQRFIDEKVTILKGITEYIKLHKEDEQTLNIFLRQNSKKFGFSHIFTIDKEGMGFYFKDNRFVDQSKEQFYLDVMENDIYVTEPFRTEEGIIITVCVSVYNEDEKQGAVCGAVFLKDIIEMFKQCVLPMDGKIFLLNRQGQYIVCEDEYKVNNQLTVYQEKNADVSLIGKAFEERTDKLGEITLDGKAYMTDITYLRSYDWAVIYCIESKEAYRDVIFLDIFRIALVIIIMLIGLCVLKIIRDWYIGNKKINIDALTKCNSRISMQSTLYELENQYEKSVTIIYFDLNKFKEVNDVYGHDEGDRILCIFSNILVTVFAKYAKVGRMGGDEFLAISTVLDEDKTKELCCKVNDRLIEMKDELKLPYDISTSFGYACRAESERIQLAEVMKQADINMYKYKEEVHKKYIV